MIFCDIPRMITSSILNSINENAQISIEPIAMGVKIASRMRINFMVLSNMCKFMVKNIRGVDLHLSVCVKRSMSQNL